jgi:hypothetical protein
LHPWLSSPEALEAARTAVQIPLAILPAVANAVGLDELESHALVLLTECAQYDPERPAVRTVCARPACENSLAEVRKGAKFCSQECRRQHGVDVIAEREAKGRPRGFSAAVLDLSRVHIGSMYEWPEDDMSRYAVRIVGYALNNWLRRQRLGREISSSEMIASLSVVL